MATVKTRNGTELYCEKCKHWFPSRKFAFEHKIPRQCAWCHQPFFWRVRKRSK